MLQRRLSARGPLTLWYSQDEKLKGITPGRADWASGRSLSVEEQRCGLLCRLSNLQRTEANNKTSTATSSAAAVSSSVCVIPQPRLRCVVKAQPADWQFNEVNADGQVAVITRAQKARWKKVDRAQSHLIEDDSKVGFDDPSKTFSPRMLNFGKYVRRFGNISARAPVLRFAVFRDSTSLERLTNRMHYEANIASDATHFSSKQSGFGCLTQEGSAIAVTPDMILHASRHYNIHPIIFDPIRTLPLTSLAADSDRAPQGNFFRVVLRCVEGNPESISNALQQIQTQGFVNYFDVGRFMITSNHAHEIAAYAAQGDYYHAVSYWLQCMAERNSLHHRRFLQYLNAAGSDVSKALLDAWVQEAESIKTEKHNVSFLSLIRAASNATSMEESEKALKQAWAALRQSREDVYHAAAEFLWNAMASQRLLTHGSHVVPGDVVKKQDDKQEGAYHVVTSKEDADGYSIHDVVLPVCYVTHTQLLGTEHELSFPHASGVTMADFMRFAEAHKLDFLFRVPEQGSDIFDACCTSAIPSKRTAQRYRPLIQRPQQLHHRVIFDPNSFTAIKTDLFMLQERLPLGVYSKMDEARIREPCIYNVSERFVERMRPVLDGAKNAKCSVVVSGFLPRGSDVTVMLRESFDVAHATFHDLLEPSWS